MMLNELTPAAWLVQTALGAGLILLVTWGLMIQTRQPALRQRLGELGLAAALVLALLALGPRWLPLPWSSPLEAAAASRAPAVDLVEPAAAVALDPLALERPDEEPAAAPLLPAVQLDVLATGLVVAYVLGAGLLLTRWLIGHVVLVRLLRHARPAPAEIVALFRASVARKHLPRLLVSTRVRVPVSCGLLRPTIVLPAALCAGSDAARLRWAFAHELTHLERRDSWSCLLFGLGQAAFFYLPWFWPVRRQVRLCQEYVADAAAAGQGSVPDYAEFLLSLSGAPAVPLGATGVSGHSSDLYRRVTMLLQNPVHIETRCPRRRLLAAAACLLGLAVVLAGVGKRAAAQSTVIIITDTAKDANPASSKQAPGQAAEGHKYFLFDFAKPVAAEKPDQEESKPVRDAVRFLIGDVAANQEKDKLKYFNVQVPPPLPATSVEALKKVAERLRQNPAKEELDQVRKELDRIIEQLRAIDGRLKLKVVDSIAFTPDGGSVLLGVQPKESPPRLGVRVEVPGALIAEQLALAEGQGLVVMEVYRDSAADKGGLKVNDILLELNGKSVPSDVEEFAKQVRGLKPGEIGIVVLRKGKREQLKSVKLAAVPTPANVRLWDLSRKGYLSARTAASLKEPAALPGKVTTTRTRRVEEFTTRYQDGKLSISITGSVDGKTPQIAEITIRDGDGEATKYSSVDAVPAQYRERVRQLIEAAPENKGR